MADSLSSAITTGSNNTIIIPGTSPTLTFTIDSELLASTEAIRLDIAQGNNIVLSSYDNIIENGAVIHHLSQNDTYMFNPGAIRLQLHGITTDNIAWKSKIVSISVGETLSYNVVRVNNNENNGGE